MIIVGIDVGLNGGIVLLDTDPNIRILQSWCMPTLDVARGGKKNKREVDGHRLRSFLKYGNELPDLAIFEKVHAMPDQGSVGMFQFGDSYGLIKGLLIGLNIPFERVPPQTWKRQLRVPAAKDGARARASELMPKYSDLWAPKRLVMNADQAGGVAEAALLAFWACQISTKGKKIFRERLNVGNSNC